jgi:hypothetical protein
MKNTLALLLCLAPAVVAQERTAVSGPVSGIVYDRQAQSLRPVMGVPGGAYLGADLVGGLETASVSPDGESALAVAGGRLLLITGLRAAPSAAAIEGALSGAGRFAWSPDGRTAAVATDGLVQVLRSLDKTPAADAPLAFAGELSALAVDSTGGVLAGRSDGLYRVDASGATLVLKAAVSALAFARGERDVFAAGRAADQLWLVRDFAGDAGAAAFAAVSSPVGLQVSQDGARVFAASADSKSVAVLDAASGASLGTLDLECTPSELSAFGRQDLWLLNSNGNASEPLYLVSGAGKPAAWFVPAGREF